MSDYEKQKDGLQSQANAYAEFYKLTGPHNGSWDAFRHAYVSAEMTRIYGSFTAKVLGDANEISGQFSNSQPWKEKNMDLWNNQAGRDIGSTSHSSADSARKVMNAINRGSLITDPEADTRRHGTAQPPTDFNEPQACCEECGAAENFPPAPWPPSPGEPGIAEFGNMTIPFVDTTQFPIPPIATAGRSAISLSAESSSDSSDIQVSRVQSDAEPLQATIDNTIALLAETHAEAAYTTQTGMVLEEVNHQVVMILDNQREHEPSLG